MTAEADRRLFYLMLSTADGQSFATSMGFSPSSPDVSEAETEEIIVRWALLINTGIMDHITESSTWLTDLLVKSDKIVSDSTEFSSVLTVYGVALVNKLLESNIIGLVIEGDEDE